MELHLTHSRPREDRLSASTRAALLMRVLDEIDYGMLLVTVCGTLHHGNQLALCEILGGGPLRLADGQVRARHGDDQGALQIALSDAKRGRRRLITLGHNGAVVSVAVLPLPCEEADDGNPLVLLVFGKRQSCEPLTIDFYARAHGLTGAEARVLQALCNGAKPKEIALAQCVAISTVRTHIGSVRQKTQTDSIRELINRVAVLPPITTALKAAPWNWPEAPASAAFKPARSTELSALGIAA